MLSESEIFQKPLPFKMFLPTVLTPLYLYFQSCLPLGKSSALFKESICCFFTKSPLTLNIVLISHRPLVTLRTWVSVGSIWKIEEIHKFYWTSLIKKNIKYLLVLSVSVFVCESEFIACVYIKFFKFNLSKLYVNIQDSQITWIIMSNRALNFWCLLYIFL